MVNSLGKNKYLHQNQTSDLRQVLVGTNCKLCDRFLKYLITPSLGSDNLVFMEGGGALLGHLLLPLSSRSKESI